MAASTKRSGKVNRRSEILRAAERLMLSRGLTGVTTREISREVGCSEGALYFHFKGRLELLLAMLEESLPDMLGPLQTLRESVGRSSAQANLATALLGIFKFHRRVVPGTAGLFAEPELLVAYRESLARQGKGPHLSMAALADYIAAEQDLGRIDSGCGGEAGRVPVDVFVLFPRFHGEFLRQSDAAILESVCQAIGSGGGTGTARARK